MPAVGRQHLGLRLEALRREHPAHLAQHRRDPLQVPRQLLDAVDLGVPLDLDEHVRAGLVAAQQVDRADVGEVLALHQRPAGAEHLAAVGEQLLQLLLDAVLHQSGVAPELVRDVGQHLLDGDDELLAALVRHRPDAVALDRRARRAHPHQRLVRAVVGVDRHRPVGLHQQQPHGARQVGGEPSDVVHGAGRDDEAHGASLGAAGGCTARVETSRQRDGTTGVATRPGGPSCSDR